jgi:hypothetical protein
MYYLFNVAGDKSCDNKMATVTEGSISTITLQWKKFFQVKDLVYR